MNIVAIDPSYTRTGVAALVSGEYKYDSFSYPGSCYSNISDNHEACRSLCTSLSQFLEELSEYEVIIEYPALATRSGAYLGILNGYLASFFQNDSRCTKITWIPPTACNSYISNKIKTKSYIVKWSRMNILDERYNHYIATALIFIKLLQSIKRKEYKNSYFVTTKDKLRHG